jgi:PQQ-like domain
MMAFVKGGTIAVLASADADAGPIEHPPLRLDLVNRAGRFRLEAATAGAQRLFGRFARLGIGLFLAYGLITTAALVNLIALGAPQSAADAAWLFAVTVAGIIAVTLVNLLYLLLQIAVAVDNCGAGAAVARVSSFLVRRPREVAIVFAVVSTLVALGTAAVDDTRIYVMAYDHILRALDRRSGNLRWRRALPHRPAGSPVVVGGTVLVPSLSTELAGYDAATGAPTLSMASTSEVAGETRFRVGGRVTGTRITAVSTEGQLIAFAPRIEAAWVPLADPPGTPSPEPAPPGQPVTPPSPLVR